MAQFKASSRIPTDRPSPRGPIETARPGNSRSDQSRFPGSVRHSRGGDSAGELRQNDKGRPTDGVRHGWRSESNVNRRFESQGANRFKMENRQADFSHVDLYTPDSSKVTPHELYLNLSRAIKMRAGDDLIGKYMERAIGFSRDGDLDGKEYALILHTVSKEPKNEKIGDLIKELQRRLVRHHKFTQNLGPTDIALLMVALTRRSEVESALLIKGVVSRLGEEVPLKISLFEDHQLAQILHAFAKLRLDDQPIVLEIVRELEMARDLTAFSSQSIVIIASSLSRLVQVSPGMNNTLVITSLWESLMARACAIPRSEMQENWPDVLLSSVAFAGISRDNINSEFVNRMATEVRYQFDNNMVNSGRVAKAVDALMRLGSDPKLTSKLRACC